MLVTDLLVLFTVMANSTYDTAMGFPGQRDCLSAGQGANSTITCSKNIIESEAIAGSKTPATLSKIFVCKVWKQVAAAEERTRLMEGHLKKWLGTAYIESRYLTKEKKTRAKGGYRATTLPGTRRW